MRRQAEREFLKVSCNDFNVSVAFGMKSSRKAIHSDTNERENAFNAATAAATMDSRRRMRTDNDVTIK